MTHTLVLARWELRRRWRSGGTAVVMAVLMGLLAAAAAAGVIRTRDDRLTARRLHERERGLRAAIAAHAAVSASQPGSTLAWNLANPDYVANDRGTLAVSAPPPLGVLSVGQATRYPTDVKVTASGQITGTALTALTPPLRLSLSAFDVEFVVVVLWPLAIIAASADALSSERERGTLVLLLAQPVSPSAIVVGSLLGRAVILGPPLAVSWLVGLADGGTAALRPLVWWSLSVAAYGWFWLGLATWVTARGHSSAAAATRLAGAWLVVTFVAPGVTQLVRVTWGGAPSDVVFADATRAAARDAMTDGSRVLGHFLEDHPTAAGAGRDGLRQYALLQAARDEEVARRLSPVIERFAAAAARQRQVTRLLQPLSPALVASQALQQAAGTSEGRARDFASQVRTFRDEWRAFLQPRILSGDPLTPSDASALPMFVYDDDHVATGWTGRVAALLWLGGMGAGLACAGVRRLSIDPLGIRR